MKKCSGQTENDFDAERSSDFGSGKSGNTLETEISSSFDSYKMMAGKEKAHILGVSHNVIVKRTTNHHVTHFMNLKRALASADCWMDRCYLKQR